MGPARKQRGRDLAGASGGGDVSDINKGCRGREGWFTSKTGRDTLCTYQTVREITVV